MDGKFAFAVHCTRAATELRLCHCFDRVDVDNIGPSAPSIIKQTCHMCLRRGRIGVIHHNISFNCDFPIVINFNLAARHRIPFYVAIPFSTIDWNLTSGLEIPIEEREEAEVLNAWGADVHGRFRQVRVANPASTARNPAFDVTPPELITGIITPQGIFGPNDLWKERKRLGG